MAESLVTSPLWHGKFRSMKVPGFFLKIPPFFTLRGKKSFFFFLQYIMAKNVVWRESNRADNRFIQIPGFLLKIPLFLTPKDRKSPQRFLYPFAVAYGRSLGYKSIKACWIKICCSVSYVSSVSLLLTFSIKRAKFFAHFSPNSSKTISPLTLGNVSECDT